MPLALHSRRPREPLLVGQVPNDLVARARGILQLFLRITDGIPKPNPTKIYHWIPAYEWFTRPKHVHELATSLILEERSTMFNERMHCVKQKPLGRLRVAPQPAAPFYFRLTRLYDLELAKYEATNRLLRIAPHLSVAFLVMLADAGLITETRKEEMRREQTTRLG